MAEPAAPVAFSVCVYCGSRPGENPAFADAAKAVGTWIGRHGGQLVYGGGRSGLMGTVAEATRVAGGRVVGVIPQALVDKELANRLCDELHIVQTMHERKAMMAERSDAFIALPGGIGTFEELFEVWTWRQLGYHDKPLGLLNVAGYYDALMGFLNHSVVSGFMGEWQMGLLHTNADAEALLRTLVQEAGPDQAPVPLRSVI
ncbi:TIGR00730 family Rossman fold protein [Acidovorax sp.]|uniref:LOG family protein n=1 Tax=Acidovorax sp. TaxID=1872122 RepID=UPI00391B158B